MLVIYAGFMAVAHINDWGLQYLIGDFIMFTLSSIIFLYALALIRETISQLQSAFPNEKFMAHHAVNFIVFIALSLVAFVLGTVYNGTRGPPGGPDLSPEDKLTSLRWQLASLLANNIELPFQTYFDLFVLYLIVKNTSRAQEEKKITDASGQDVPSMVFLRNQ